MELATPRKETSISCGSDIGLRAIWYTQTVLAETAANHGRFVRFCRHEFTSRAKALTRRATITPTGLQMLCESATKPSFILGHRNGLPHDLERDKVNTMAGQLIPPPEMDVTTDTDVPMEHRIARWFHGMSFGRKMFEAGAKMREGSDVNLRAAWREHYQAWLDEHDEALRRTFGSPPGGRDGH